MRRFSDGVEAALHCALVLAGLPENAVLSGKSLATLHGLSETYLLKHLRQLAAAGVVKSVPGPRGGYRLAHSPRDLSMLDIVEAIDGTEPAFVCRELRRRGPGKTSDPCAYARDCFIKSRMLAAEDAWRSALRRQTLADLLDDGEKYIDAANKRAVAEYVESEMR